MPARILKIEGKIQMKRFEGLLSASPEKRYRNFISTVVDREEVWLLSNKHGYATYDDENYTNLLVWSEKAFAEMYADGDTAVSIEIHDFCQRCEELTDEKIGFLVFYNGKDAYWTNANKILNDIQEELSLVE